MTKANLAAVLKRLGLEGADSSRDHLATCPFHKDRSPSLSVHPGKGVYRCFSCGAKGRVSDLFVAEKPGAKRDSEEGGVVHEVALESLVSPADVRSAAKAFVSARRLTGVDLLADVSPGSRTFGYLEIPDYTGTLRSWRRLFPGGKRYLYAPGQDGGVLCARPPLTQPGTPVWIVEGGLDAWALALAGAKGGVYSAGGSDLDEALAYALQDHHVMLAMDNDVAGFMAAKRAEKTLADLDVPFTRARLRKWKDPGEAWQEDGKALSSWVHRHEERLSPDERAYVKSWLAGTRPFLVLPTGVPGFDRALGGGYKPGLHTLQGMTTVGKSSMAVWMAYTAAKAGKRVVYATTELTKDQVWARLASCLPGAPSWVRLEDRKSNVPAKLRPAVEDMATKIRVLGNRSVRQLAHDVAALGADLLVVDYLQRLHGAVIEGEGATAASIGMLTGALGDLAQEREMVVLAISSMNRAGYDSGGGMGSAKGSGDIEYYSQSLVSMVRAPGGGTATFRIEKNTRGEVGAQVEATYEPLNCRFGEAR